jgi:hypothetical protein
LLVIGYVLDGVGDKRHPRAMPAPAITWPDPHAAGRNRSKGDGIHNAGV